MIKLDARNKVLLLTLCIGHVCNGLADAIQAPFYPPIAASKGVTPTIIGLVFGINNLVSFLISPILGQFIKQIGSKFMMVSGIFIVAISSILFGLLDLVENKITFIAYSFLLRIVLSYGNSCYLTASFSIGAEAFQDNMYIVSTMESCFGIGLIVAPFLGGILYAAGGFIAPFAAVGLFILASGVTIIIILPTNQINNHKSNYTILHLIRNIDISLLLIANFVGYLNRGFIDVTLSLHLEQFNVSPLYVGLIFLSDGISFALSTPLWAYIGYKYIPYEYVVLIGCISAVFAYNILGPAPYIPLEPSIANTIVGLMFNGFGVSATSIASFIGCQKEALNYGLPKDLATFGLVSGLWASSLSLGLFTGSTFAGPLLQYYEFQNCSVIVIILNSLLILLFVLQVALKKCGLIRSSKIDHTELTGFIQETEFSIMNSE